MTTPALPRVIAHRGASAEAPENTLRAFARAFALGCRAIELDVHLSKDGVPVVLHDDRLERTTNGAGAVSRYTAAELARFDAGGGERIPTLREALALAREAGGLVNVEVKADGPEPGIEAAVAAALNAEGMTRRAFVTSFDPDIVQRYRAAHGADGTGTGVILLGALEAEDARSFAKFADAVGLYVDAITPDALAVARAEGLAVVAWVVNERERAEALIEAGVAAVITDDPAALHGLY